MQDWVGILLCMASARSAAMAFNRLVDRDFDALNPRTAGRHLPTGRLSVRSVALFTALCASAFIASTLLFLPNRWPLLLSVPVLCWLLGYSYTKRFTSLAHFWLGASLSLAPIAAWIALRGGIAWPPLLLALAVLCWVSGFDIIYACQDVAFDSQAGLKSVPSRLGVPAALRLAAICHALMILFLLGLELIVSHGQDLLGRYRRRGRAARLRARPGPPRRSDPGEPRLLPRQCHHQHGTARFRAGGPGVVTVSTVKVVICPLQVDDSLQFRLKSQKRGRSQQYGTS